LHPCLESESPRPVACSFLRSHPVSRCLPYRCWRSFVVVADNICICLCSVSVLICCRHQAIVTVFGEIPVFSVFVLLLHGWHHRALYFLLIVFHRSRQLQSCMRPTRTCRYSVVVVHKLLGLVGQCHPPPELRAWMIITSRSRSRLRMAQQNSRHGRRLYIECPCRRDINFCW
jgi:hypothetical protein